MMRAMPDNDDAIPLVDVVIEDARWQNFGLQAIAERSVRATLAVMDLAQVGFTVCVMGCDDDRIAALNGSFRSNDRPTNVLSWPAADIARGTGEVPERLVPGTPDDPVELGDIALAFETCMAEATGQEKPAEDHVSHLIVHGLLHLLGYDHQDDADAAMMEALEVRVLAPLGISDPY